MAAGFVEYEVLIRHTVDLQVAVKDNLTPLGAELVAAQVITPDQYEEIRNAHRSVYERGADLVGYVQNKVFQNPWHYHTFLGVLRSDMFQYGDVLAKLEQARLSLRLVSERQPLILQPPPPREDGNPLPAPGYVEYEVLIRHTVDLQVAVKDNLTLLGAQFVAAQIITPDQYEEIRNAHRSVNERGADLVGYVQNKVYQNPWHYHTFIDVLRSDLSQYGDIVTKLEQARLSQVSERQPVIPQPSSSVQGFSAGTEISIQDVATQAGLETLDILDQECSQQVLLRLAKYCVDWQMIGFYLKLTTSDIVAVDVEYRTAEQKRVEILRKWKEKFAFRATYRVFIAALLLCGKTSDAIEACKDITSSSTGATRLSDSDHSWIYEKLAPHATKWRDIGRELGFKKGEMDHIQSNPMLLTQSPPESYLREMLSQWLQWAPGDGRGSTGFATRELLRAALLRANLGQLAQQFYTPSEGDHTPQHSSQAEGQDQHTVNVPSGHILTKEELQVLGAMLATYSDEKLKSIQLSLQEEQEIRDISREEVEKSLRQSGLASMANALKDNIEKGIENMKHYRAYEEALKGGLSLTLRYLKFLFFGPPRSGKTSTRRRLLKEIINLDQLGVPSISTGVAETNDVIIKTSKPEDVTIKKLTSESVAIAGTEWKSMKSSKKGTQLGMYDEEDLAQLFYQLIYKRSTSTTPATSSEPIPMQDSNEHSKNEAPDASNPAIVPASTNNPTEENTKQDEQSDDVTEVKRSVRLSDTEKSEINDAFKNLTTILQSDSPEDLKRLLEDLTMINMADVGGQPAFLDMLPALTIGPALYLLFFRLDQELQEHYPVHFLPDEKGADIVLETSYCIEEVLYQCLASIVCFSSHSQADPKAVSKSTASSRALLFGTYKDKVDNAKISQIQSGLLDKFKGTMLYKDGLLLKPQRSKMAFVVDNMKGTEESEMVGIRNKVEVIIKEYFPAIPIPASWLMFRVVLHLLKKPVLSLTQCEEIAKRLSMPTSVQEAIWFFHHDIGSLMHYSNISSMEDTVICNPQVIFDSISKLIIDKFQCASKAITECEIDEFHQRGLFTLSCIQDTTQQSQSSSLLELNQLVDVLKHHNILAEVKQDEEVVSSSEPEPEPKFIMPAVLKHASEKELNSPILHNSKHAIPLFIHFETGFVPFGVFSASIARFISHQRSTSPQWKLYEKSDSVRRNKLTFLIDERYYVTLISRPQHFEIRVEQYDETPSPQFCSFVRQTVVETLETVIAEMKYKPFKTSLVLTKQPFDLAFTCCMEDKHDDHLMIVDSKNRDYVKCSDKHSRFPLPKEYLLWFDQDENSTDTDRSTLVESSASDQHNTPPESDVPSATQKLMFSSSMSDEDFFKWLRSKGVNNKDCKTLSDNGIAPSGFLLCDVEDFDDIGLTKVGKKRVLEAFTEVKAQHHNQKPEDDHSHVGSRGHAPQHSSQVDRRDERTINDNLEINDLNDVKHALWDARAKWKDIGSCIGIDEGTLDTMKLKEPGKSLDDLLSHWLRGAYDPNKKNSKPRTWRTLIIALRDKIVNEAAMADELEKEKYPDTNQAQHSDQQRIARKRSHEGSRGHTPQHSSQAEGRHQHTDNETTSVRPDSSPSAKRRRQS